MILKGKNFLSNGYSLFLSQTCSKFGFEESSWLQLGLVGIEPMTPCDIVTIMPSSSHIIVNFYIIMIVRSHNP